MAQDYIARKSAKKRRKKVRQDEGKEGVPKRERKRRGAARRMCQGLCYKKPSDAVTAEDREWPEGEGGGGQVRFRARLCACTSAGPPRGRGG